MLLAWTTLKKGPWISEPREATHWREVYSEILHLSCPQLNAPHLILPGLNQGLSLVSSPLPVPLLAVGKGKPPLFEKTRVTANQDRHKAEEEAAVANQIRMRTQLRGGDPGLARQMQAGRSPPRRGGKNCCVALHAQAQLSCGSIGTETLSGRTPAAIVLGAITQSRHSITVSTLFSKPTRAATGSP